MSASAFSSCDTAALERQSEAEKEDAVTYDQIWNDAHRRKCSDWIRRNGHKKVCLQFPDSYLGHSSAISESLSESLAGDVSTADVKVFILADTCYGSCCVDEIAAAHVDADSIIHFGSACRSKVTRLPVLYLFPQLPIDLPNFYNNLDSLSGVCEECTLTVYLDIGYHHLLEREDVVGALTRLLPRVCQLQLVLYCGNSSKDRILRKDSDYRVSSSSEGNTTDINELDEKRICLFVGSDNDRFFNLSLTTKAAKWFIYDVASSTLDEKNPLTTNFIRRRYHYIEKCKDARTLGLVVATLTANGYLDVVSRLQAMAKSRGIKTQIISVGRINPAKLANFLEIDCFVLIACPFNNMYNSKDYYKPIVSVFEAEMALNPAWYMRYPETYVTDFKQLLPTGRSFLEFSPNDSMPQDVSLVSGHLRNANDGAEAADDNDVQLGGATTLDTQQQVVAPRPKMEVMTTTTGLSFEDRTWKGLQPALGGTEPAKLQKGLSGIPTRYTHE